MNASAARKKAGLDAGQLSSRESASDNLNLMLEALHDHGAIVDRVDADGMVCEFMSRYTGDEPLERAPTLRP